MSSGIFERLTKKKGDKLSKFLGIDSGISTRVIADMQARINNPLFNLSIADYEAMCGNKMMVRMMSKVIGCDVKQLKKFCKYINVFAKNIKSSPKSIKKKIDKEKNITATQNRGSLNKLPDDVYRTIVEQYKTIFKIKYVLKNWIPLNKLDWGFLSINPNAIELLKANPTKIDWDWISSNPNAIEFLKENPEMINWGYLSANPNAIELLKKNFGKISWYMLSENTNPAAIELLKANKTKIDWDVLSTNPAAMDLLKKNPNNINWVKLSENPNAMDLIKANLDRIDWSNLTKNPNPEAIELLKANPENINWDILSLNPNPEAIELLRANPIKINWMYLSSNPSIFEEIGII